MGRGVGISERGWGSVRGVGVSERGMGLGDRRMGLSVEVRKMVLCEVREVWSSV